MIKKWWLKFRQKRLFKIVRECGCDFDGDIIIWRGKRYFIDYSKGQMRKIKY